MKFRKGTYVAVTGATLLLAAGAGVYFAKSPTQPFAFRNPDILSIMHSRSPGERAEGALLVKKGTAKLAEATPAAMPKAPILVAPAAPAAAPIATAATPVPAFIPAVAPAAPAAVVPAAAHAGSLFFPPVIIPGSHTHTRVVTPPTPPPPPPPVPGVPEPQTWIMMIVGFGLLGMFLRRRNRSIERSSVQLPDAAAASVQRS